MSMRHTAIRGRRTVAAVALATVTALTLAGCSGGGDTDDKGSSKPSNAPGKADGGKSDDGARDDSAEPEPKEAIAEVKGDRGITITINSAIRDPGGFVTVKGDIINNGDESFTGATYWRGTEEELNPSGSSVAGAALVDLAGKKRYYVLRDTDGRCLCTMRLVSIAPKETRPFFAQFPAPPEKVTKVEFQLPTMPPAQIELSR